MREQYGLIFAYLGPTDRMPALPRFDILENLQRGERLFAHANVGIAAYGDAAVTTPAIPYNWFQWWENSIDHYHVWILHSTFSVPQFDEALKIRPQVEFKPTQFGVAYHALRAIDGRTIDRVGEAILPNIMVIPGDNMEVEPGPARSITWGVPVDDTSFLVYEIAVGTTVNWKLIPVTMTPDGKTWSQMSESEHQAYPGDFEAQASQGTITVRSAEHLVQSDRGIMMLRRLTLGQIAAVENGMNPLGVAFTDESALIRICAGNFWMSANIQPQGSG